MSQNKLFHKLILNSNRRRFYASQQTRNDFFNNIKQIIRPQFSKYDRSPRIQAEYLRILEVRRRIGYGLSGVGFFTLGFLILDSPFACAEVSEDDKDIAINDSKGLKVAFDVINDSEDNHIQEPEFTKFCRMATTYCKRGHKNPSKMKNTTLRTHLFGDSGSHNLNFEEFCTFVKNIQREVLRVEFLGYSQGVERIPSKDFAEMLLRYSDMSESEKQEVYNEIEDALDSHDDEDVIGKLRGLSFSEVETFFQLLNNISDLATVFRMFPKEDRSLNKQEFFRAAKICLNGQELSEKIISVIFLIFDRGGDDRLSFDEFIMTLKDRLNRRLQKSEQIGLWNKFKKCVRDEVRMQNKKH